MLTIAFRADASASTGEGHVRRCQSVANHLQNTCRVVFIHGTLTAATRSILSSGCYEQVELTRATSEVSVHDTTVEAADADATLSALRERRLDVDRMVVDHYGLSSVWHGRVMNEVDSLLVIDDLANRQYNGNALIDPTYGRTRDAYVDKLPEHTQLYQGVDYACLRPQFAQARTTPKDRSRNTGRIHLLFGGIDALGYTARWAKRLLESDEHHEVLAAVGEDSTGHNLLQHLSTRFNGRFRFEVNVHNMANQMSKCDLAVGSPGTALWERACLGIPTFCLATAPNQHDVLKLIAKHGLCVFGGDAHDVDSPDVLTALRGFLRDDRLHTSMRKHCAMVDGKGARRVADIVRRGY